VLESGGKKTASVIGGGLVGICCAAYLLRRDFSVILIERAEPGRGASFGNGGNLLVSSSVPHSLPGLMRRLPRMLLDRRGPVTIGWRHLPRLSPWLCRFALSGTDRRAREIARGRHALLSRMVGAYSDLVNAAAAPELMRHKPFLYVWESEAAFKSVEYTSSLRRELGISFEILSGHEARDIEPALAPSVSNAIMIGDAVQAINPLRLAQSILRSFRDQGGHVVADNVLGISMTEASTQIRLQTAGEVSSDVTVIAAGVASRKLAESTGIRVPLEAERGYHSMIAEPGIEVTTAIASVDRSIGLTPMEEGLRIVGVSEFSGRTAPPQYERCEQLVHHAQAVLPNLEAKSVTSWMGERPSFPDSLPMIGKHPRGGGLLFAFGHDHIGMATAAITGRIIASLATGDEPEVDLIPYRPTRFN
jgi:glycine/D-amino acid oxidase-like deaminating enzyme